MFDTVSGIRTCDVTGDRTRCLCVKLRQPKRTYYVSRELIIDMLEGVVGTEKPFIVYPRAMTERMKAGLSPVELEDQNITIDIGRKEDLDGKQSGDVLPPVLDTDESVLPSDAGKDDGSGAGSSGTERGNRKAVKKTKKKKAKRKGQKR
jgi:hypothetical protein